jgi:hypothetical protein
MWVSLTDQLAKVIWRYQPKIILDLLPTFSIFSCKNSTFCDLKVERLIRIRIRMDPHWFDSLDPDPH